MGSSSHAKKNRWPKGKKEEKTSKINRKINMKINMKINKGPQKNQHKIDKNIDFKINKGNIENINTKINIQYQQKNG